MVVGVIAPAEERRERAAGVQLADETAWVVGLILQRLELRLAEGVVVDTCGRLKLR